MIPQIPRDKWNDFFGNLSRTLEGWDTKIEVLSPDIDAQTLSIGLPFGGVTLEEKDGQPNIELTMGADAESHIAHKVEQPVKVAFEDGFMGTGSILDIEDWAGAKTLITFVQPFPVTIKYESTAIVSVG